MSDRTTTIVIWVATGVWAGNVIVGMFNPDLSAAGVNAIFTLIVGGLFAERARRNGKHRGGDE